MLAWLHRRRALRMRGSGIETHDLSLHVLPPNKRRTLGGLDIGQTRGFQATARDAARVRLVGEGGAKFLRAVWMFADLRAQ